MGRSAAVATSPPASEHPHASSQGASPTEAYGFVGFILSGVAFALYLLWAYVPDDALRALGVACSPDKYWAVALPTWAGVALVYAAVAYESLCMLDVKRPEDVDGMEELSDAGAIPRRSRGDDPEGAVPAIRDLPLSEVCRVLYRARGGRRRVRRRLAAERR